MHTVSKLNSIKCTDHLYDVKDIVTSQTTHVKCRVGDDSDTNSNLNSNLFQ